MSEKKEQCNLRVTVDFSEETLEKLNNFTNGVNGLTQKLVTLQPFISFEGARIRQLSDINAIIAKITEKLEEDIRSANDKSERFDSHERQELAKEILGMLQGRGISFHQAETVLDSVKEELRDVRLGKGTSFTYD